MLSATKANGRIGKTVVKIDLKWKDTVAIDKVKPSY